MVVAQVVALDAVRYVLVAHRLRVGTTALLPCRLLHNSVNEIPVKLDRELQREILIALRDCYPLEGKHTDLPGYAEKNFVPNMCYLADSELITASPWGAGSFYELRSPRITAKGIDFLERSRTADDIAEEVRAGIDPEEIRALLTEIIEEAPLSEDEKEQYQKAIRSASVEQLLELLKRLGKVAVERLPDVLRLIEIGSGVFS